jgi:hypothetical protein
MKLNRILIILLISMTGVLFAQATDLIISEYVEGSSYQKAIEIFNGTGSPVDLSTVSLKKQTNGAGTFGSELILSGTLANNDVYVIVNSTTGGTNLVGQPYVDLATTSQAVNFNGNDAVGLFRNGVMIDVVGIVDQVDMWGADMTLIRNPNIASPSTVFSFNDWTQHPQNYFNDLGMHTFTGGTTDPYIMITYPNTAVTWYYGQTYTITWTSGNFDGNVNIGIMNGDVLSVIDGSAPNTGSYDFTVSTNWPAGNQYRVRIGAVSGAAADTSDAYFSIMELPVTNVATLSQLRSSNPDGTTIYRVTGETILTYQQTYRHKKWFQDATGAIEIDDYDGTVTTPYQIGDAVAGIIGTLNTYHNMLQFVPFANFPAATSSGNAIDSPVVTINELNTNFENYESRLVYINNASFLDTSTPFATGTVYNVTDGTGQIAFRTNFFEADYIGQAVPTGQINMRVITTQYDNTYQITARALADFTPVANDDEVIDTPFMMSPYNYPNPFRAFTTISYRAKSSAETDFLIYNVKGQLIRHIKDSNTKTGENRLIWDSLDENGNHAPAGIYLYNVRNGKYTSSGKMILVK